MATTAPPTSEHLREVTGFGGVIPCTAVAHGGDTLVAALGLEHHADGSVLSLLMLSAAPGLLEWNPSLGLVVSDDRGDRYDAHVLSSSSGLGQLSVTLWIASPLPAEVRRLEVVVDGVERINPTRGGGPGVARVLSGGPWNVLIDLVPERTVVEPPPEPVGLPGTQEAGSVPIRAHGVFVDVVPVGQARLSEGVAVCVLGLERYWDRSVVSLVALGSSEAAQTPAIGRARVDAWDAAGHRYRVTPVQGASRGGWSEVAVELVPAIPPGSGALGLRISELPIGADSARRDRISGSFVFGIRLPAE
jgi:hypothetical protein